MRQATPAGSSRQALTGGRFQSRFLMLIGPAWTVPVLIGLWYLRFIEMFTAEQLRAVMSAPGKPLMNLGVLIFISVYFWRCARPIAGYLDNPARQGAGEAALRSMRRFPMHFWALFVAYMLLAPSSMIVFAEMYAGYEARPEDWFRIHLVALVVSIIVGLPIFELVELCQKAIGGDSIFILIHEPDTDQLWRWSKLENDTGRRACSAWPGRRHPLRPGFFGKAGRRPPPIERGAADQ